MTDQRDPVIYDTKPVIVTQDEVATVREILTGSYPDFVLEVPSASGGLGEFLADRGSNRALVVRADAEQLRSELIEWFGEREVPFEVEDVGELLDTPFDGYVLLVPAVMPELWPFLLEREHSDFFLATYVASEYWDYTVEPRDHAPSVDDLQAHFGHYAPGIQPTPPPAIVDVNSRLRLYLMRHLEWTDANESVTFILSERDGQIISRS